MTLGVLVMLDVPLWTKGLLALFAISYSGFIYSTHARFKHLSTDGRVWQLKSSRASLQGSLSGDSTLNAWFMVLRIKSDKKRTKVSYVLFADSVPREIWRRLRVLACYGG